MPRPFSCIVVLLVYNIWFLRSTIGQSFINLPSQAHVVLHQARLERFQNRRLEASTGDYYCSKSWLGYQCTQLVCGRIRIHWSLGSEPPSGVGCSFKENTTQISPTDSTRVPLLHIALQTDLTEYVALSWPSKKGRMANADAVIGFQTSSLGTYKVAAYKITGKDAGHVQPDDAVNVTNARVEANRTALTICFTRNISQVGQGAGIRIDPHAKMPMNFVASKDKFGMLHSVNRDHLCAVDVTFALPIGDQLDNGWRPSNTSDESTDNVREERLFYMRTHGALQFTGWIVLVPIGILAARHRWIFAPISIVGLWFQVHRAVQMVAIVLIVSGFVLPWASFNSKDEEAVIGMDHDAHMASDLLLESHESLAIVLMVVLVLHIAVAILRPKPEAHRRWMWNLVHWWTGRGLALIAGVNVVIGIALWRRVSGGSGLEWIVPLVVFAAVWMGLAAWLERRALVGLCRNGSYLVNGPGGINTTGYLPCAVALATTVPLPTGHVPMSKLWDTQTPNTVGY